MSDYIKRKDAIKAVAEYTKDCFGTFEDAILNAEDVVLDSVPSADVIEPKRGEWIDMGDFEQCSVCKGTHLKEFQTYYGKATWIKTNFCPYCGADMRGKGND